MVVRSTVGALQRVRAFEAIPLWRLECCFIGPVFSFVAGLTAICAVRGEDALTRRVSSFLTEGTSTEFGVRKDLYIVGARSEGDEPLLVGTSLHEISQLLAASCGDLDVPRSACVSFEKAVDFRNFHAHVGYHGFDDFVREAGRDVEDYPRVSDVGAMIRKHRSGGPRCLVPCCLF